MLSWNLNGIRAAARQGFGAWLAGESLDVFCGQETKAHLDQLGGEIAHPAGYHSYWSSAERKGYSGVVMRSDHCPIGIELEGEAAPPGGAQR